jgi:hypothetical protein
VIDLYGSCILYLHDLVNLTFSRVLQGIPQILYEPGFSTVIDLYSSSILYLHELVNLTFSVFSKVFLKMRRKNICQPRTTTCNKFYFVWLIRRHFVERLATLDNITVKPALLRCQYM